MSWRRWETRLTGVPKEMSKNNMKFAVTPLVLDRWDERRSTAVPKRSLCQKA